MKLSVLQVGKFYPPVSGGMERMLQMLCEGERAAGIDTRVLVANTERRTVSEDVNGVPVTRVASVARAGAVEWCPGFPAHLRRSRADVIVLHEPNPIALVSNFLVRPRVPMIVWFHSEVVRPRWRYALFYEPFLSFTLQRAARIVVSSPALAQNARALRPYRAKCVVIPFGFDPARFARDVQAPPNASPTVLFVGRMVEYKGVDILLRALGGLEGVRAILVGDGPRRLALQELAADLGLAGRVAFEGEVSDERMAELYAACDVFVLPSVTRAEAFGLVQLEAMAAGKAVVSTSVPTGVPWVNQHERTGLIVPPGDVPALRRAIDRLLQDPDLRRRMGQEGRARVARDFTPARMIQHMVALYREVSPR
ncbi:MAG TPA: glycosyltransferase [Vicinamibacterales bacterium]|nr:glycosyltransferase [Vicinamibacterales bacterium]